MSPSVSTTTSLNANEAATLPVYHGVMSTGNLAPDVHGAPRLTGETVAQDTYMWIPSSAIDSLCPSASRARTAHQLETLSVQILDNCNARNYGADIFKRHVSPDLLDVSYWGDTLHSLDAHVDYMNSSTMRHFRAEVINCVADVKEKPGTAKVWVTVRTSGLPVGLFKETVSLLYWRRNANDWMCWKHESLCQVSPLPV